MGAVYPTSLVSFTNKEDKIDIVYADHINKPQLEIVAMQTEMGLNPAGSLTNLVDRLALLQDTDGSFAKGAAFPTSPIDGQGFYKTDDDVLYIYNGADWEAQGQSLSNLIFRWTGCDGAVLGSNGVFQGTGLTPDRDFFGTTPIFEFMFGHGRQVYGTILHFQYRKLSGQTTAKIKTRLWAEAAGAGTVPTLHVNIGGQTGSAVTATNTAPAWVTGSDIDISGLDVGTFYDCNVALGMNTTTGAWTAFMSALDIIAF